MEILRRLLQHPEFSMVLQFFCTALFGWPFISIAGPASPADMFVYLFFVWAAIIVLLLFIAQALRTKDGDNPPESGN